MSATPEVLWAQRSSKTDAARNYIYLTIAVPDVSPSDLELHLGLRSLTFTGHSESVKKTYRLELEFFAEINEKESKIHHTTRNIRMKLGKKVLDESYWPRLLKDSRKAHFLKTDFDKWVDEDEQSGMIEEDFLSFPNTGSTVKISYDPKSVGQVLGNVNSIQGILEQLYSDESPDIPTLTSAAMERIASGQPKADPVGITTTLRVLAGEVERRQKKASDKPGPFAPELLLGYQDIIRLQRRRDADVDMRPVKIDEDPEFVRSCRQISQLFGMPDEQEEGFLRAGVEGMHLARHLQHKAPANHESLFDPTLKDSWSTTVENSFPRAIFGGPENKSQWDSNLACAQLCTPCSRILDRPRLVKPSSLRATAWACELCKLLRQRLEQSGAGDDQEVKIFKVESTLKMNDESHTILRICSLPGPKTAPRGIQIGLPRLPEAGSPAYFAFLRVLLNVCDECHEAYECCKRFDGTLPSRVLDVGDDANPGSLRLHCTTPGETGRYITLSHRWGNPKEHGKFCTYLCNIGNRRASIDFDQLPKTFQDAVTVARELSVQFLWIDSICIIQPHEGCSAGCFSYGDWEAEAGNMERYYHSAYCTIAATSAKGSSDGFIKPRRPEPFVSFRHAAYGRLFICPAEDDFQRDVEEAEINHRGWVLQERALSRRTIHFASTQVYWECGEGVRCETMTSLKNSNGNLLGEPNFPNVLMCGSGEYRVRLFQAVFEAYSRLALTHNSDRPIAVSGLEARLAKTFETGVRYGIFEEHLHRCLVWRRSGKEPMKRIEFRNQRKVPSWSWMACEGEIKYLDIPLHGVEWSTEVEYSAVDHTLKALVQKFSFCPTETATSGEGVRQGCGLVYDGEHEVVAGEQECVVLGREKLKGRGTIDGRNYYILIVRKASGGIGGYKRVGIGIVQGKHILEGVASKEQLI